MKALTKKTKIVLIAVAVAVLVLLGLVVLFLPELIQPVLVTLLLLGVGFFLVEFYFRKKRKKNQVAFDEKVSAKEGIEDRRREWAGWLEELERQGIDRYELPFYLIVGEPQSGKSVLLQNSDLYFPFGQERLSGVGGTRGCDWWFTDEAVILDIAGRLFTHEGGVADKLEWESFLGLLTDFRPMCPAHGVVLVVPCSALLEDSPEVCADKANKIQSALLTLTQKLEAQLPVYLVLTKGDRLFGFAESVHRLDGEERQQMFGWSREADRAEKPFELDEAKAGFARMVDRARLLRERMIASARLPEALPEIDRMYAFPDELNGMYAALEIYLKRIFTQSSLVERASFRGIYLTSGLQSGAPVAKVCAELLGENRESDSRTLESLFSHQRAYFIKDLVRKRVFAERGLVRPTEGRVLAARRTAVLGYGAAAALALVAVVGSAIHMLKDRGGEAEQVSIKALEAGRDAMNQRDVALLLTNLDTVHKATSADRELMQDVFRSTREGFERLYAKMCDRALAPLLRQRLEEAMLARAGGEPGSFQEFEELLDGSLLLFDDLDFSGKEALDLGKQWLPVDWKVRVADAQGGQVEFTVADALQLRRGSGSPIAPVGDRIRLDPLARRLLVLLDRSIDPATAWLPQGHLGYMVARQGAESNADRVKNAKDRPDYLEVCDVFRNSLDAIDKMIPRFDAGVVTNRQYLQEIQKLNAAWAFLSEFTKADAASANWPRLQTVDGFVEPLWTQWKTTDGFSLSVLDGKLGSVAARFQQRASAKWLSKVPVRGGEIGNLLADLDLRDAAGAEPRAAWTLRSIEGALARNNEKPSEIYPVKVQVMAAQFVGRFPNWAAAREDFHRGADAPPVDQLDQPLVAALAKIRAGLGLYKLKESPAPQQVSRLLEEHLRAIDTAWANRKDWGSAVDWSVPMTLTSLAAADVLGPEVCSLADRLRWAYLRPHEERLQREWRDLADGKEQTLLVIAALNTHLGKLAELEKSVDGRAALSANAEHKTWIESVDGDLVGRLQKHLESQLRWWRPDTSGWVTLRQAVDGVSQAMEVQVLRTKIRDAAKNVDSPATEASELRAGQPVVETTSLPQVTKVLTELRGFVTPTDTDIRNHKIAQQLRAITDRIRPLLDGSDQGLAALAVEMLPLPASTAPLTTVEHYLRPLHDAFQKRLVAEVRSRYLRAVAREVFLGGNDVLDALYAQDPAKINAIDDGDVVLRIGSLLNPRGRLDLVRRDYRMVADPKEPTRNLYPPDDFQHPTGERDWWQFERFLGGLRTFLVKGESKVEEAVFRVRYDLPRRAAGPVWDIAETKRQFFYYAADSTGKAEPGFVAHDREWGKFEKLLAWEFHVTKRPVMWLLWTNRVRTESFRWPQSRDEADLSFELTGSLAPLVLAWSGVEEGEWWNVSVEPQNSKEKAKLRLSFVGVDGLPLVLPARPPRPIPFPPQ